MDVQRIKFKSTIKPVEVNVKITKICIKKNVTLNVQMVRLNMLTIENVSTRIIVLPMLHLLMPKIVWMNVPALKPKFSGKNLVMTK